MTTATLTPYQQHLITWAKEDAANAKTTWPGTPLSQVPLAAKGDLHHLIDLGLLEIVEVESQIRAGRINHYVVAR
jgi:hypothetical protein